MFVFDLGQLHAAIIHFPISLVIIAFVFDLLYFFIGKEYIHNMASWFIIAAAVVMVPTVITGLSAQDFYPLWDPDVERHQDAALVTFGYTVIHALFRGYALYRERMYPVYVYILLSLINVGLINITAELGGIVVRGQGIMFETQRTIGTQLPYGEVKPPKK